MPEADALDQELAALARQLAAVPLLAPSRELDRRIAAIGLARWGPPGRRRLWALPCAIAALLALGFAWWRPPTRVDHAPAASRASAAAPIATHRQLRCWAQADDGGIVEIAGKPMRLWRTRLVTRLVQVDPSQHLRITCQVSSAAVSLVSQPTL